MQWTEKSGSLADFQHPKEESIDSSDPEKSRASASYLDLTGSPAVDVRLRLEGSYFTAVGPSRYKMVVCFVAGTGVSGTIVIAGAFVEMRQQVAAKLVKCRGEDRCVDPCCSSDQSSTSKWERCVIHGSVKKGN